MEEEIVIKRSFVVSVDKGNYHVMLNQGDYRVGFNICEEGSYMADYLKPFILKVPNEED